MSRNEIEAVVFENGAVMEKRMGYGWEWEWELVGAGLVNCG